MEKERKIIANITVGKPDIAPQAPAHIKGVREGNEPGSMGKEPGIIPVDLDKAVATARRSTGICADDRNPIDPDMPNLTAA